jgi:hypothetical protein
MFKYVSLATLSCLYRSLTVLGTYSVFHGFKLQAALVIRWLGIHVLTFCGPENGVKQQISREVS